MKSRYTEGVNQKDLPGVLVLSHGLLAAEMLASAEMILGPQENAGAICFEIGDRLEDYQAELIKTIKKMPEGSLAMLDLFAGTPCNQMTMLLLREAVRVEVFAGVNLPTLIEVFGRRGKDCRGAELIKIACEVAPTTIVDVGAMIKQKLKAIG